MSIDVTPQEREILVNLGQPRSVQHLTHELMVDPAFTTQDGNDVLKALERLQKQGLVVNLGEHLNPVDAVKKLPKAAFPLHDESAEIFSERLKSPRHRWRTHGDLWILGNEGVDLIKAPHPDEGDPMTVSQVQAAIDDAWSRTISHSAESYSSAFGGADKPDGPRLAQAFLEEEFLAWATAVADDCEARWGERPLLPLAGGAGYADGFENSIIDAENQKTALGAVVDPWYMALTILALTDTDTGTTTQDGSHVPTYTGYARKSVAGTDMAAASGGSSSNSNAIQFADCTAGSSNIVSFANTSASTNGTLRKYGNATGQPIAVSTTQTPPKFAVGAYVTSVD